MSAREWKPGDVALIEAGCHANRVVAVRTGVPNNMGWAYSGTHDGRSTQAWSADSSGIVTPVRPLVVIDPEDDDAIRDLTYRIAAEVSESWQGSVRVALRSLVTPPKPEEPKWRWARVLDDQGREWCRTEWDDGLNKPWQHQGIHCHWQAVKAVGVLSEGVRNA